MGCDLRRGHARPAQREYQRAAACLGPDAAEAAPAVGRNPYALWPPLFHFLPDNLSKGIRRTETSSVPTTPVTCQIGVYAADGTTQLGWLGPTNVYSLAAVKPSSTFFKYTPTGSATNLFVRPNRSCTSIYAEMSFGCAVGVHYFNCCFLRYGQRDFGYWAEPECVCTHHKFTFLAHLKPQSVLLALSVMPPRLLRPDLRPVLYVILP